MKKHIHRAASLLLAIVLMSFQTVLPVFADFQTEGDNEPVHLALGKTAFTIRYGGSSEDLYPNDPDRPTLGEAEAASISRLTDGVMLTDPEHRDFEAKWVNGLWNEENRTRGKYVNFYRGGSRDITLDLGQLSHVSSVTMHVGASAPYGIGYPTMLSWYLSEDNSSFYKVGDVLAEDAADDPVVCSTLDDEPTMTHKFYTLEGMNYNARYVRVRFDVPVWIFMDEMQVLGEMEPSSTADALPEDGKLVEVEPVNAYASTVQSGGVEQEYLAYQGWGTVNGVLTETYKTVDEYKEVISYEDRAGKSVDWMYDGITVLPHSNTSRNGVYNILMSNVTSGDSYAQKSDWSDWITHVFAYDGGTGAVYNMDALEEAVRLAKAELEPTESLTQQEIDDRRVRVKMAMTPTVHFQDDWGTVDTELEVTKNADGSFSFTERAGSDSLDFTLSGHGGDRAEALSDRASAIYWYLNAVIDAWEAKDYEHLVLDGFYYYEEKIVASEDALAEDTVKVYNALIDLVAQERNAGKFYSYWIPFYLAEGFKQWNEYGFDYAIMQPNYIFDSTATSTRIDATAELAYTYGLGVEIEYSSAKVPGFKQYLLKGETLGYQGSVQAWYWGTWDPHTLANSSSSSQRELYDQAYAYIKGQSINSSNLLDSAVLTLDVGRPKGTAGETQLAKARNQLGTLTDNTLMDGAWSADNCVPLQPVNIGGPIELTANLGRLYNLNEISLSTYDRVGYGISEPHTVMFFVSDDGASWQRLDSVSSVQGGNAYSRVFTLRSDELFARYIKAQLYYKVNPSSTTREYYGWLAIEEFSVKGTAADAGTSVRALSGSGRQLATAEGLSLASPAGTVPLNTTGTLAVLADGAKNGMWSGDYAGCTQASAEGPYQLTADLGEPSIIYDVSLNFFHWSSSGVGEPENVVFSYSQDGETWTRLGTVSQPVATAMSTAYPTEQYGMEYILSQGASPFTARYIRADFDSQNNYLTQSGTPWGWIAMDEFTIMGIPVNDPGAPTALEGENILTAAMLSITMDDISNEQELQKANAAVSILVDGLSGAKWPYAYNDPALSAYIGFHQGHGSGPYYVTADLNAVYNVTGMAMDFYHEAAPGLYRPDSVTYEVSLDGTAWTELAVVTHYSNRSIPDTNAFKSQYVRAVPQAVKARYVRAVFDRARRIDDTHPEEENHRWSWIGFDEIKVVGTLASDPEGPAQPPASGGSDSTGSPYIPPVTFTAQENTGVSAALQAAHLPKGVVAADVVFSAVEQDARHIVGEKLSAAFTASDLPAVQGTALYDMDLLFKATGEKVDFTGSVTVRIPVPEGFGNHLRVFHVADTGELTEVYAVIENGVIVFHVNHFSYYAIVDFASYAGAFPLLVQATIKAPADTEQAAVDTGASQNPRTGATGTMGAALMLMLLSGVAGLGASLSKQS